MNRVGRAGDEGMPPGEISPFGERSVGACDGKPRKRTHRFRRQFHAILYPLLPTRIVLASARLAVEQRTAEVRVVDFAAFVFLELDHAAARATVAQAFPLARRHLLQGLGPPEWTRRLGSFGHCNSASRPPGATPERRDGPRRGTCALARPNIPRAVSFWRRVGPAGTLGATAIARQAVCEVENVLIRDAAVASRGRLSE